MNPAGAGIANWVATPKLVNQAANTQRPNSLTRAAWAGSKAGRMALTNALAAAWVGHVAVRAGKISRGRAEIELASTTSH